MKKLIAFMMASAVVLTSCGTKKETKTELTLPAEKISDIGMYRKEKMAIPDKCAQIWCFMPYNSGESVLLVGAGAKSPQFWTTSDLAGYTEVEIPDFDIGVNYNIDTANDGTIVTLVNHTDSERDKNGEFPPNAEFKFIMNTYRDGVLISSSDVEDFGVDAAANTSIGRLWTDGSLVIVELSGGFEMFTVDGKYLGELTSKDGDIDTIGKNRSGQLICTLAYVKDEADKLKLCTIGSDGTLTDYSDAAYDFEETPQGLQQGMGEYDLFLYTRSTVYGVKQGDPALCPLLNIPAASLTSDMIDGIAAVGGDIAVLSNDYANYAVNFNKYFPVTKAEMEDIPVLTVGSIGGGGSLTTFVNEWNEAGHDFRLEAKDYEVDDNGEGIIEMKELREDMLLGNLPDVMWYSEDYGANLARNGAFCDLYEFIDKDEVLSRDCFVPNVLECFSTDDALYTMPTWFAIDAGTVAKTRLVGSDADLSMDRQVDFVIDPPIDIELDHDSKYNRLGTISYTAWLDRANMTCHYDDGSFERYLDWCNIPEDVNSDYSDLQEMTDEEQVQEMIRQNRLFLDDKALTEKLTWYSYENFVRDTRGMFGGEELTYFNEPELHTVQKWAITTTSDKKELAWELIKSRICDEEYKKQTDTFQRTILGFPVTKTGIEMYLASNRNYIDYTQYEEITDPEWLNYHGVIYKLDSWIYGENTIKLGEITDEDVAVVNDFIARAKPSTSVYAPIGNAYYEIMEEEISDFLNGKTTSHECAKYIQDRVSTYLSEKS